MNLENLINTINTVHQTFQAKALQSVSVNLTLRNFVIGYYIVEYEQNGRYKAAYGSKLIENLAQKLAHIKGMSVTALKLMRQFYLTYPQISQSLTDQFSIDGEHDMVDLVFYHRVLKCHVLVDLKVRAFSHADVGQMNFYLNYYKNEISMPGDNPPIGIILCTEKNNIKVEYASAGLDKSLFVSKYQIMLPSTKDLEKLVKDDLEEIAAENLSEK